MQREVLAGLRQLPKSASKAKVPLQILITNGIVKPHLTTPEATLAIGDAKEIFRTRLYHMNSLVDTSRGGRGSRQKQEWCRRDTAKLMVEAATPPWDSFYTAHLRAQVDPACAHK